MVRGKRAEVKIFSGKDLKDLHENYETKVFEGHFRAHKIFPMHFYQVHQSIIYSLNKSYLVVDVGGLIKFKNSTLTFRSLIY